MRALGAVLIVAACGRTGFDRIVDAGVDDARDPDSIEVDAYVHVPANRAFVTSFSYLATFGGAAMATTICQEHADMVPLGGTWVAVLGDDTQGPIDALAGARGWEDLAGNYVADLPGDWLDESMPRPLRLDQTGVGVGSGLVWLGAGGSTCTNWSAQAGNGSVANTTNAYSSFSVSSCGNVGRFACVETAKHVVVDEPRKTGRLLFVTVAGWVPTGGVAAADAHCAASAVNLPGTFRAALSLGTAGPFARIANPASGFVSIDGRQLLAGGVDLTTATNLDAFVIREDGSGAIGSPAYWVWMGTPGSNCTDWTTTAGNGTTGDGSSADVAQLQSRFDYACTQAHPLLCVQD